MNYLSPKDPGPGTYEVSDEAIKPKVKGFKIKEPTEPNYVIVKE